MANYFSYMRISTREEREMQRYNRQEKALEKYVQEHGIELKDVYQFRDDISGKSFENRADWNKLEKLLQPGDTIIFKDITRFTREAENGYKKYMELLNNNINLIFIDNPTISTDYIKTMMGIAQRQENRIAKKSLNDTIELLILVELDRAEREREIIVQRIRDGLKASNKKAGRKPGQLDKLTEELRADIVLYLADRSIKAVDLMKKHNISRNTFKKYVEHVKKNM